VVPGSEGGRGREGEREGREGGREGRGRERAEEKRRGEIGIMFSLEPRSACQSPSCPPDPPNCSMNMYNLTAGKSVPLHFFLPV